jgi:hypothetical protein
VGCPLGGAHLNHSLVCKLRLYHMGVQSGAVVVKVRTSSEVIVDPT